MKTLKQLNELEIMGIKPQLTLSKIEKLNKINIESKISYWKYSITNLLFKMAIHELINEISQ